MATDEHSRSTTAEKEAQALEKKRRRQSTRIAIGTAAMIAWLGFFSAGLLVESVSWRKYLAPGMFEKQAAIANASGSYSIAKIVKDTLSAQNDYHGSALYAFFAAAACFTPTNLAFLALLAGLIGGCASNVFADQMPPEARAGIDRERLMMLEETPWAAAMRSFIVYLCVIAGLYLTVDDPFKDSTPAQFLRLAGLISALAFVVGYDPSRIQQWIRLLPSPTPSPIVKADSVENMNMNLSPGSVSIQQPQNESAPEKTGDVFGPSEFHGNGKAGKPGKKSRPKNPR